MIFATENAVADILAGRKTQTRRLVKEGEHAFPFSPVHVGKNEIEFVATTWKKKWQVGRDYAVQTGRGKPGLWHCPKCKVFSATDFNVENHYEWWDKDGYCGETLKPLRIKLIGIRKEHLLDMKDEDAKKEGFENTMLFFEAFMKVNRLSDAFKVLKNPWLWVLDFEVK